MILSPGRLFVFIHIPKTGGTALALALEARAKSDDIMAGDTPKAQRRRRRLRDVRTSGRLWKHSTLSDLQGLLPQADLDGLFAFTMVRNPWDRCVSYYHWLQTQRFAHPAVSLAQSLDFESFVLHPQTLEGFRNSPARSYMQHPDGAEHCDCYIRLENFTQDAVPLFDHLGFAFDLPRANASVRDSDYRSYYSPPTRRAIAQACQQDIERFDYRF